MAAAFEQSLDPGLGDLQGNAAGVVQVEDVGARVGAGPASAPTSPLLRGHPESQVLGDGVARLRSFLGGRTPRGFVGVRVPGGDRPDDSIRGGTQILARAIPASTRLDVGDDLFAAPALNGLGVMGHLAGARRLSDVSVMRRLGRSVATAAMGSGVATAAGRDALASSGFMADTFDPFLQAVTSRNLCQEAVRRCSASGFSPGGSPRNLILAEVLHEALFPLQTTLASSPTTIIEWSHAAGRRP